MSIKLKNTNQYNPKIKNQYANINTTLIRREEDVKY